jgi:spermidine synthase
MTHALLASVFIIASCGLAYELIAAALSSYLIGDSVTQFSTVIGVYLFAMGVGSFLSRYITKGVVLRFIQIELMVALLGGFSALALFLVFAWLEGPFRFSLYAIVLLVGMLVGLEIPLVMRMLRQYIPFRDLVAQVLTFDYLGALAVSLAFPLLLAPQLGLVRSGLMFGVLNALVAVWAVWLFRNDIVDKTWLKAQCAVVLVALVAGFAYAEKLTKFAEQQLYAENIVYASSSPYQRIVLTRWRDDVRLYLNHNLQFSSRDEYRYHEAMVHPALQSLPRAKKVLILGGGDGLAAREVLRYPGVESIVLVDLDPEVTRLFSTSPVLRALNRDALKSSRVKIFNVDALQWLEKSSDLFDFIVVDFPDPSNYSLGKLYTSVFYRLLARHLAPEGLAVIQSTSPLYARQSFWCVVTTLENAGLVATPYHALVPSFGAWGFIIAGRRPFTPPAAYELEHRFLTPEVTRAMFLFPKDMDRVPAEVNRLNNQILVRYFEREWRRVIH